MATRRSSLRRSRRSAIGIVAACAAALGLTLAPAASAAPAPGVVTGTVTGVDGNPLRGVDVTLGVVDVTGRYQVIAATTTKADGRYRLVEEFSDDQYLQFDPARATGGTSPTGYASLCYRGAPWCTAGGAVVKVPAGATRTVDAALQRAGVLTGRARDSLGRGVGGVRVTFYADGYDQSADSFVQPVLAATTDVNGNYAVGASPWSYGTVCFSVEGVVSPSVPSGIGYAGRCDSVQDGDAPTVVKAGRTTVRNTVLAGAGYLVGTVVGTDGAPISGATVASFTGPLGTSNAGTTAADGTFRVAVVPGRTGYLAYADGYRTVEATARVQEFTTTRVGRIVLARAS